MISITYLLPLKKLLPVVSVHKLVAPSPVSLHFPSLEPSEILKRNPRIAFYLLEYLYGSMMPFFLSAVFNSSSCSFHIDCCTNMRVADGGDVVDGPIRECHVGGKVASIFNILQSFSCSYHSEEFTGASKAKYKHMLMTFLRMVSVCVSIQHFLFQIMRPFVSAMYQVLLIFFYRRIRKLNTYELQSFKKRTVSEPFEF